MKKLQNEVYEIFKLIYDQDIDGVQKLARNGYANATDELGDSALIYSIQQNKLEFAKILLDNGADPASATYLGDNGLHLGSKWGNVDLVQLMLKYKIDIDAKGQDGFTAINYALAFNEDDEIAQILYHAGASIDIPDHVSSLTARERALEKNIKFSDV